MDEGQTFLQGDDEQLAAQEQSLRGRQPPTSVPGYDAERFLGAGAYGEVWLAVDRNTRRKVAIKFYAHRGGLDWSLLSREVEKLAFLFADRRVVQLLAVGWDSDPPYYVMEFLEDGSLEDRLQRGPMPVAEALEVFREVCLGLMHSHAKGVLHCDLKPANVLLGRDGKPRIADFGQSRLSHEQSPALGTLYYMAPEQADLNAVPTVAWDVYALGALLYRMLVGQPPHRSATLASQVERAGALEQRLAGYRKAIEASKPPQAHRAVAGVDRNLAEIIERCLDPDPKRRFPNVQSVLDALEQRRIRRARRPLLVMGAVGPALLLGVMTLFAWNGFRVAMDDSRQAVLERASESNRFAAQFVAEAVARQIDHRYRTLEQIADDEPLRRYLDEARREGRFGGTAQSKLEVRLEELLRSYKPERDGEIWFLCDAAGVQLVRVPKDNNTIGRNFAFRDYFHGGGADLPPDTPGLKPVAAPYQSIVFVGKSSRRRQVAFSAPVRGPGPDPQQAPVLGVLATTVELGSFAELRSGKQSGNDQLAMLVDVRPDEDGKAGSVLEHPHLNKLLKSPEYRQEPPKLYVNDTQAARLQRLIDLQKQQRSIQEQLDEAEEAATAANPGDTKSWEEKLSQTSDRLAQEGFDDDYTDPVGGEYDAHWLAALEPVVLEDATHGSRDTGWVVIIQERYESVIRPIYDLGSQLVRRALLALGVVLGVVTALWGFVIALVSDNSRLARLLKWRRSVGLATEGPLTDSGSQGVSGGAPPSSAA